MMLNSNDGSSKLSLFKEKLFIFLKRNNFSPLVIAGKIPGAWHVQIKNAGHALFVQYPDKVNKVLQTFLSATTGWGILYLGMLD
jgi:hypothetical protein